MLPNQGDSHKKKLKKKQSRFMPKSVVYCAYLEAKFAIINKEMISNREWHIVNDSNK